MSMTAQQTLPTRVFLCSWRAGRETPAHRPLGVLESPFKWKPFRGREDKGGSVTRRPTRTLFPMVLKLRASCFLSWGDFRVRETWFRSPRNFGRQGLRAGGQ